MCRTAPLQPISGTADKQFKASKGAGVELPIPFGGSVINIAAAELPPPPQLAANVAGPMDTTDGQDSRSSLPVENSKPVKCSPVNADFHQAIPTESASGSASMVKPSEDDGIAASVSNTIPIREQ